MMRFALIWIAVALASTPARADIPVTCPRGSVFDQSHGCVRRDVPASATYVLGLDALSSDPKKASGLFDTACKARYAAACTQLGAMYQSGRGRAVVKDEAKAQALFEQACELGDGSGCQKRGDHLMSLEPSKALTWLEKGCAMNEGVSCAQLGYLIDNGVGGAQNRDDARKKYDKAFQLMNKACPKDGLACLARGFMYTNGIGTTPDPIKALASFLRACDARNHDGCMEAAKLYDDQDREPQALKLYERACLYESAHACSIVSRRGAIRDRKSIVPLKFAKRACDLDTRECEVLAYLYDLGYAGLPQPDREKATALFKSLCDGGDQSSCVVFAKRALAGTGMTKNPERADKLLEDACTAEEADACSELAVRYTDTKADDAKGYKIAQRGCNLGSNHACFVIGWMIVNNRRGAATQSEEAAAKEALPFYETACEKNSTKGCYEAARLHEAGIGTPKDIALAVKQHRKACEDAERPNAAACASLGDLYYAGSADLKKDADEAIRLSSRACALDWEASCNWLLRNAQEPAQIKEVTAKLGPACDTGEHDLGCYALGQVLMSRGTNSEKRMGFDITVKACGRKHAPSCNAQLQSLFYGVGTREDKAKAELLAKQYCDAGDGNACVFASIVYRDDKNGERRLQYADLACTLEAADGCNEAGFMYYTSAQGTRWNITAAADYYIKACKLDSALGCSNHAELARFGILGAADPKKAAELYKKSCELDEWIGCSGWAHYLRSGEGGQTKDLKKATELFQGACNADVDSACVELAEVLESDNGSVSEIARLRLKAFELTRKQADSNPAYMYWLGVYFKDGMGTAKDEIRALEWFSKACDGFDPLGCIAAGKALSVSADAKDRDKAKAYYTRACAAGVDEGCTGLKIPNPKAKLGAQNPATVQTRSRGCGSEVAPGGKAGLVLLMLALGWLRRARRMRCR
jgi:TPR repeat protein